MRNRKTVSKNKLEAIYGDNAIVVTEPDKLARVKEELRHFFGQLMASRPYAHQLKTHVIEADGIALSLSRWTLVGDSSGSASTPRRFIATCVFRKQPSGNWSVLIDNSLGLLVLGPE